MNIYCTPNDKITPILLYEQYLLQYHKTIDGLAERNFSSLLTLSEQTVAPIEEDTKEEDNEYENEEAVDDNDGYRNIDDKLLTNSSHTDGNYNNNTDYSRLFLSAYESRRNESNRITNRVRMSDYNKTDRKSATNDRLQKKLRQRRKRILQRQK